MNLIGTIVWRATLVLAITFTGCSAFYNPHDYYAEVVPTCNYLVAGVDRPENHGLLVPSTRLRPECRAKLLETLHFDDSWGLAPEGLQDEVLEAFQTLLAYPLRLPRENRVFGMAPGALPTTLLCIVAPSQFPDACPGVVGRSGSGAPEAEQTSRALFNYVLNSFDSLGYQADNPKGNAAFYDLHPEYGRRITFYGEFQADNADNVYWHTPLLQAAILVHEALHSEGRPHTLCQGSDDIRCDPDLSGPQGLQLTYLLMTLHAGVDIIVDGAPLISYNDIIRTGQTVCDRLKDRINTIPRQLEFLIGRDHFCADLGVGRILELEGLFERYEATRAIALRTTGDGSRMAFSAFSEMGCGN